MGRNCATSAPPIEGDDPVGEITTGGEENSHGSAAVVGTPAIFTPWSSFHAIFVPSWENVTSRGLPTAGM